MLSFVDADPSLLGLPPAGRPKCKSAGKGCVPYAYDAATGWSRSVADIVGQVVDQGLATDGWRSPTTSRATSSWRTPRPTRSPSPEAAPGSTGAWHFRAEYYPVGHLGHESVTFRKNGTYALYYAGRRQR